MGQHTPSIGRVPQGLKHCEPTHMVVRADPINRQHGHGGRGLRKVLEGAHQLLGPALGRECILVRLARRIKALCELLAKVRDTSLRRTSPTTRPRTPPEGFRTATFRPSPIPGSDYFRDSRYNRADASSSSRTSRNISPVRPLGPGAVPRRRATSRPASFGAKSDQP